MTAGPAFPLSPLRAAGIVLLLGCQEKGSGADTDMDGDRWTTAEGDCDDAQAGVHPGETEIAGDGVDQNCDASDAGPVTSLSEADGTWYGAERGGRAGWSVSIATDMDQDGFDDVLIGAPTEGDWIEVGSIFLLYGPATATGSLRDADVRRDATSAYDDFGYATAAAGDTSGDGWGDVLIGAGANPEGGFQAGAVYLGLGPEMDLSVLMMGTDGRATGTAMAGSFDLDGDGVSDVHIGSPSVGTSSPGRTDVLLGPLTTEALTLADTDLALTGETDLDYAGESVAAGDLNGDGYGDLVIGAPLSDMDGAAAGRVYVVFGPRTGTVALTEADMVLSGETAGAEAGISMACVGDLNGDGTGDLAIGAHLDEDPGVRAGKVYVLTDLATGIRALADSDAIFRAEGPHEMTGLRLAGTVSADGEGAVLAAAPRDLYASGGYPGKVYRFDAPLAGALGVADVSAVFAGASPDEVAGVGLGSGGDLNGDGVEDIAIGAPYNSMGEAHGGAVYLTLGER